MTIATTAATSSCSGNSSSSSSSGGSTTTTTTTTTTTSNGRAQTWSKTSRTDYGEQRRRAREERVHRQQQEQRQAVLSLMRKKFKGEESAVSEHPKTQEPEWTTLYDVELWKERLIALESLTYEERYNAVEFFRRMLSTNLHPPFELLLTHFPSVVPLILALLEDHRFPLIQYEAAWCITNIACATTQSPLLFLHQAVRRLMVVVAHSREVIVQNQCLWALFNISTEAEGCAQLLNTSIDAHCAQGNFEILLSLVDIPLAMTQMCHEIRRSPRARPPASPYSAVLRQVAFILCNIIKRSDSLAESIVLAIASSFAELLYSPEGAVVTEVLSALTLACAHHETWIQHILEQGIAARVCDLLEHAQYLPESLQLFCVLLQSPSRLQQHLILYEFEQQSHPRRHPIDSSDRLLTQQLRGSALCGNSFEYLLSHLRHWIEKHGTTWANAFDPVASNGSDCHRGMTSCASNSTDDAPLFRASSLQNTHPIGSTNKKAMSSIENCVVEVFAALDVLLRVHNEQSLMSVPSDDRSSHRWGAQVSQYLALGECCRQFMSFVVNIRIRRLVLAAASAYCSLLELHGEQVLQCDMQILLDSMLFLFRMQDEDITLRTLNLWDGLLQGSTAEIIPAAWMMALRSHLATLRFHDQPDIASTAAQLESSWY